VYELPKIAASIAATSPALPQKTLTVAIAGSVRADLTKETVTAELTTKLDESTVQAKFGLARFAAPHSTFDLNVDRLDVDRYFPPEPAPATGQAAPSGPGAPADTPIDLSALKGLSVDGRVRIGALTARRIQLAKIRAPLRVANGRLEMSPHEASLYGGSIAGALALDSGSNRVALKETLQGVAVGPLARDLLGRDLIEGRGDIALDVAAAGASVNAMKKSLAGSARVSFADGAVKGINLAEALRKAKAALGSKSAQQQLADKSQKTDFSELKASFVIKDGVAHNEDLTLKSPFFRIAGSGDVDVGASAIDYKVRASIVATAKGQGGVDLSDVAGLTIPVRIAGPFDTLKFELDYGAALREKAKSRIGERLGGGQAPGGADSAPLEDRAKDKLRKLFRR
jgi:AsmA protein